MFEQDEGTEQRMKIDILKMVYYMLCDFGEDSGAEAIARAIFEITADEEGKGAAEGAGNAWHIYAPPKKREQKLPGRLDWR